MMTIHDFNTKIQKNQDVEQQHRAFRQLSGLQKPAKTLQESTRAMDEWFPWG